MYQDKEKEIEFFFFFFEEKKEYVGLSSNSYDRLFNDPKPDSNRHQKNWKDFLNSKSKKIIKEAYLEPSLQSAKNEEFFQFERLGYFCVDNKDSDKGKPIFNRIVSLRDSWLKQKKEN